MKIFEMDVRSNFIYSPATKLKVFSATGNVTLNVCDNRCDVI